MSNEHTGDLRDHRDSDTLHSGADGGLRGAGDDRSRPTAVDPDGADHSVDLPDPVAVRAAQAAVAEVGQLRGRQAILTWLPTPMFVTPDREPDPPAVA